MHFLVSEAPPYKLRMSSPTETIQTPPSPLYTPFVERDGVPPLSFPERPPPLPLPLRQVAMVRRTEMPYRGTSLISNSVVLRGLCY